MAGIDITEDQMRGLVAGVITSQMVGEQRDRLITAALEALLMPKTADNNYYGRKASPLAECFERAVYAYAQESCKKYIDEHAEVRAQLDAVVADGFKKALVSDRDETVAKVANAVSEALYAKSR